MPRRRAEHLERAHDAPRVITANISALNRPRFAETQFVADPGSLRPVAWTVCRWPRCVGRPRDAGQSDDQPDTSGPREMMSEVSMTSRSTLPGTPTISRTGRCGRHRSPHARRRRRWPPWSAPPRWSETTVLPSADRMFAARRASSAHPSRCRGLKAPASRSGRAWTPTCRAYGAAPLRARRSCGCAVVAVGCKMAGDGARCDRS